MNIYENQIANFFYKYNITYDIESIQNAVDILKLKTKNAFSKPYYTQVYACKDILKTFMSNEEHINRIVIKLHKYLKSFRKNGEYIDVIDTLSIKEHKRPLYIFKDIDLKGEKRFAPITLNENQFLSKKCTDQCGYLLETYIITELNNNGFKCPECSSISCLTLCEDNENVIDSFRDAICLECYKQNIKTIFEIKTRNKEHIYKNIKDNKLKIYAGDYVSINTLIKLHYSVYIILYARDTGDIIIGKIVGSRIRPNERYLYGLQEKLDIGSLASDIICINLNNICNIQISNNYITNEHADVLSLEALNRVLYK